MTLARIILNNARQRRLSTLLTSLSIAFGVALIIAILTIKTVSQERLRMGYSGFDLVIGTKGSPLQLVLNVVYHLDISPGNIPFSLYQRLQKDPRIKWAAPFSVGDNYKGFRIIGTTDIFLKNFNPVPNHPLELSNGRFFEFHEEDLKEAIEEASHKEELSDAHKNEHEHEDDKDHHHAAHYEAVVGSTVADETGLKIGETFVATHGVQENEEGEKHEHSPWTVVGILKQTGTPVDRAIYINLDSFYHIEGHVIEEKSDMIQGDKRNEPEPGQISAIAIKARGLPGLWSLRKQMNESLDAQAAQPAEEIRKLLKIVGNVDRILLAQAILIVIVSAIGTGLAMFNSMNARRRDIAVMRALGAKRRTIVIIIVGEALLITLLGSLLGLVLGHVVIQAAAPFIQSATGFIIPAWTFHEFEIAVIAGVLFVGITAGIGPAISAYRTDVATRLSGI